MITVMPVISLDMDGTLSPCLLRWEWNKNSINELLLFIEFIHVCLRYFPQIGDRVGPVGTGETNATSGSAGVVQRLSPVNWSMVLNRQEALVSTAAKPVLAFWWQNDTFASCIFIYFCVGQTWVCNWNQKGTIERGLIILELYYMLMDMNYLLS